MKIVGGKPSHERKAILEKIIVRTCQQGFFGRGKAKREFRPLKIEWDKFFYDGGVAEGSTYTTLNVKYDNAIIGSIYFIDDKLCMRLNSVDNEEQYQKALELAKVINEEIEPIIVCNQ